ncbi:MAG: hypothetical protein F4Z10_07235 [Synechococcus sp. SB0666_bin_14]|nr:hypothetical protein [Synechococcus sp. SB0666_bin_14]MYA91121.1 hypothetical protein [Synechococcus sp. SB0663_bin_10]MYG46395.1 hypothetical protein [Synechococcus sp. SB0675_bin_6]MYJ59906.1 hypothetical protein [Synechococcus sp. SB0672_bin_6]MYK90936.1 hypothetical protein [Synechococcus sp. SB0669_bin_8]
MSIKPYTTAELDQLRLAPKRILNPRARWSNKPQARPIHRQRNFEAVEEGGKTAKFQIYQRQNLRDEHDFSCGIRYLPHHGEPLTLARHNGPSHEHGDIAYRPHIHRASERAILAGRKPESDATPTDRFQSLEGALACLVEDFNVCGLNPDSHPQLRLQV